MQSEFVLNISPTHSWEFMANYKNIEPQNPDYWTDIKPENTLEVELQIVSLWLRGNIAIEFL